MRLIGIDIESGDFHAEDPAFVRGAHRSSAASRE